MDYLNAFTVYSALLLHDLSNDGISTLKKENHDLCSVRRVGDYSLTSTASVPGRSSALGVLPTVQVSPHTSSHSWMAVGGLQASD